VNLQVHNPSFLPPCGLHSLQVDNHGCVWTWWPVSEAIDQHLVYVFNVLHLVGAVGFTLILISAFLSRAKRHPIWFNFCVSWIAYCLSACTLFFAGQTANPSVKLCIVQAALAYSAPPLVASATLSLVIYLLLALRSLGPGENIRYRTATLLLAVPWAAWLGTFLSFFMRGIQHSEKVTLSYRAPTASLMTNIVWPTL
ncbi:hypothetical protein BD779DRAFT_1529616, partial [Infundibulicybe gibba]